MITRVFECNDAQETNPDGSGGRQLRVLDGAITLDSSWSPYVQASLSCVMPDARTLNLIDPRQGGRTKFTLRQDDGSGPKERWFDLSTRARTVDFRPATMELSAASDEALMQDYARGTAHTYPSDFATNTSQLIQQALNDLGMNMQIEANPPDPFVAGDDAGQDPGDPAWSYISQLTEAAGAWFYVNEHRTIRYAPAGWAADTSVQSIDGIVDVADTVSRDDASWANAAVVAYLGNSPTKYAFDSAGDPVRKTIVVRRQRRKPGSGNAATRYLQAAQRRGRTLTVTAIADLDISPNQQRRVTYFGTTWTGIVQSVTWRVHDALMTVRLNVIES